MKEEQSEKASRPRGLFFFFLLVFLFFTPHVQAQSRRVENALLWRISGNGLPGPSYLYGTFHLLPSSYLDSLTGVKACFDSSKAVLGEMVLDTSTYADAVAASFMDSTTLDQLLTPREYKVVAKKFKTATGMDLSLFNTLKPVATSILYSESRFSKFRNSSPVSDTGQPMDLYFQQQGAFEGKEILGLETMEDQINVLYNSIPLKRQAKMLYQEVTDKRDDEEQMETIQKCYAAQDLECLSKQMSDGEYNPEELKLLLGDRNSKWLLELPALLKKQSSFIAVGAMHLAGLVTGLRAKGFSVVPIKLR